MAIWNLTAHVIVVRLDGGMVAETTFPPCGKVARIETAETPSGQVTVRQGGTQLPIPVIRRFFDRAEIPTPDGYQAGDHLIVSSLVLEGAKGCSHPLLGYLLAPDTGATAVRENGQVKAVRRFVRD